MCNFTVFVILVRDTWFRIHQHGNERKSQWFHCGRGFPTGKGDCQRHGTVSRPGGNVGAGGVLEHVQGVSQMDFRENYYSKDDGCENKIKQAEIELIS